MKQESRHTHFNNKCPRTLNFIILHATHMWPCHYYIVVGIQSAVKTLMCTLYLVSGHV
jgi:hypothetical protein